MNVARKTGGEIADKGVKSSKSFGQAFLKACAVEAAEASSRSAEREILFSAFLFANFFFAPQVSKKKWVIGFVHHHKLCSFGLQPHPDRFFIVCRGSFIFDKLEFVCMLQCFHKQVFLISAWNIGKSADYLISMLFIKFGGLPTHCIKMNMVTSSADGVLFGFK